MRAPPRLGVIALALALALASAPGRAQPIAGGVVAMNLEQVFSQTMLGKRMRADHSAAVARMETCNDNLRILLEAEEARLAELRSDMPADEFRGLADAFDAEVRRIRTARARSAEALERSWSEAHIAFLRAVQGVLGRILTERGGAVLLDNSALLLATNEVDITSEAILRIDEALGDGMSDDNIAIPAFEGVECPELRISAE